MRNNAICRPLRLHPRDMRSFLVLFARGGFVSIAAFFATCVLDSPYSGCVSLNVLCRVRFYFVSLGVVGFVCFSKRILMPLGSAGARNPVGIAVRGSRRVGRGGEIEGPKKGRRRHVIGGSMCMRRIPERYWVGNMGREEATEIEQCLKTPNKPNSHTAHRSNFVISRMCNSFSATRGFRVSLSRAPKIKSIALAPIHSAGEI